MKNLFGPGAAIPEKLRDLAGRLNGFEILVGRVLRRPFARLPKAARPPDIGNVAARIYLTDTLESPNRLPDFTASLLQERLTEERARAQTIKKDDAGDLVCIGNPPYDRESDKTPTAMREGAKAAGFATATPATSEPPILEDLLGARARIRRRANTSRTSITTTCTSGAGRFGRFWIPVEDGGNRIFHNRVVLPARSSDSRGCAARCGKRSTSFG